LGEKRHQSRQISAAAPFFPYQPLRCEECIEQRIGQPLQIRDRKTDELTRKFEREREPFQNAAYRSRLDQPAVADGHACQAKGEINARQLQSGSLQASSLLPLWMLKGSSRPDGKSEIIVPDIRARFSGRLILCADIGCPHPSLLQRGSSFMALFYAQGKASAAGLVALLSCGCALAHAKYACRKSFQVK
jgi:hypothetical protein